MMAQGLVALTDVGQGDVALVGGKAAMLGALLAAGFPVPPGLCVTTAVFHEAIAPYKTEIERLCQLVDVAVVETAVAASEKILTLLQNSTVPKLEIERLGDWEIDGSQSLSFAVRSSATAEDRGDASFAGQYATVLGVRGEAAIETAVLTCWHSFFSPNALFDRAQHGALSLAEGMAVLIQPIIEADCAGVCLTVDPIQERDDLLVINAAWGLGVGVVDGTVPTDFYWVRRQNLGLEEQRIVEKDGMMGLATDSPYSPLATLSISDERRRVACLPEDWVRRVAEFGLAVEQVMGVPQDVEWAIVDGRFWLLQSRPMTSLPQEMLAAPHFPVEWGNGAERHSLWRLSAYSDGMEPPLPLEHDFMQVRESVREETCRAMGAERNEEMQLWNGRAYYRPIPLDMTAADMQIRRQAQEDLQARLQAQGLTSWDYFGPEIERMTARLRAFDKDVVDGSTLADHLAEAQAVLRYCSSLHPRLWFKPRPSYFAAFTAVSGLTDAEAETAAYQLLDGEESKLTRLIDGLYELAQVALGETEIANLLTAMPNDVMVQLATLPEAAEFHAKLAALLVEYGERIGEGYGSEMTVRTPTWHEEPARVLELVRAYLTVTEAPAAVRTRLRQARDGQMTEMCLPCEDEMAVAEFQRQLAYARQCMVVLEDHNHAIEQVAGGQLRLAIMAAARWLVAQGILAQMDDVFWLKLVEIEAALRGGVSNLPEIIAERRIDWAQWVALVPPPILGMPGAVLPPRGALVDAVNVGDEGGVGGDGRFTGLGASSGQVEGRACVVAKGQSLPQLEPGTILVARNAGPLWTPYFPQLGGLVLEEGSLGQHAAATAREYGIPTVINCHQATRMIADGALVRVDGRLGTVMLLEVDDFHYSEDG